MLKTWLTRNRPTGVGACSIVAVDADRAMSSAAFLGMNFEQPQALKPRVDSAEDEGVSTIAVSKHLFLGRNREGLTIAVVMRHGRFVKTAERIGRRILRCCIRLNQVGDAIHCRRICADVVAADATSIGGWRGSPAGVRYLKPVAGLLTLSAGHSNADPLPGGGWLIEKLSHLESRSRISRADVQQALEHVRIGSSTGCTIIVEPTNGQPLFFHAEDHSPNPIRKSA